MQKLNKNVRPPSLFYEVNIFEIFVQKIMYKVFTFYVPERSILAILKSHVKEATAVPILKYGLFERKKICSLGNISEKNWKFENYILKNVGFGHRR